MEHGKFNVVRAIHPHWNGCLILSNTDNLVVHEGRGSIGTYELSNGLLTTYWRDYNADVFHQFSGIFVHEDICKNITKIEQTFAVSIGTTHVSATKISVEIPTSNYEISLRLHTTDISTFEQVFVRCEYENSNLPKYADTIVDLGANIGLATVFFGLKYPDARILSVEPERSNFAAMVTNTAALGDRVEKQHAAVWVRDGFINVHTESEDGSPLGAWGVQVSETRSESKRVTKCFKLSTLLDNAEFNNIDILKVDIEGAELEVFSNGAEEWLSRINLIIIETHDRFRPGSEEAVRKALHPMFEELPPSGESLFFRRRETVLGSGPTRPDFNEPITVDEWQRKSSASCQSGMAGGTGPVTTGSSGDAMAVPAIAAVLVPGEHSGQKRRTDISAPSSLLASEGTHLDRIDATAVRAAYRAVLGREPESEAAVLWHLRNAANLEMLLRILIGSWEFRMKSSAGDRALQEALVDMLSYFSPRKVVGCTKIRVGNEAGDGGYVMVDDFKEIVAVISAGIENDVSWDEQIANRGIDVYQFDHTVSGPPVANERFHFFRHKISSQPTQYSDSIRSAVEKIPTLEGRLILKIDIEGAEWEAFDAATVEDLRRFAQVVGEFHGFCNAADDVWRERAIRTIRKLHSIFEVVHVHGNNWSPLQVIANVPFPEVIEITFANRSMYQFEDTTEVFPTPMDRPNDKGRPDIFLGPMPFRSGLARESLSEAK